MLGRVLSVPNWSFGRDNGLLREVRDELETRPVLTHFAASDLDHNRTVTAFSGSLEEVEAALFHLAEMILPRVDLQRHTGAHPRIGALDVCPFIPCWRGLETDQGLELRGAIEMIAERFSAQFEVPVFLYEHSSRGDRRRLPELRSGGFGGLVDRAIAPDYGPNHVHPHLGATVMGWRDPLIALNMNLNTTDPATAEAVAKTIRQRRREGEELFRGVRALGLALPTQEMTQISMNITRPSDTPLDPFLEWLEHEVSRYRVASAGYELIGVIRDVDMEFATKLSPAPEQIVPTTWEAEVV